MSAPTRQFGSLSIDTQMPTTRRQAQGRSSEQARELESSSSSTDADSSDDEKPAPSTQSRPKPKASVSRGKQPARSVSPASSTDMSALPLLSRAYKTRDILSTFDPEELPSNFRSDIFEEINRPRTPAQCLIQLDLEGTIFRLAVNDHAVYKSLSEAQPVKARAVGLFQKVTRRIKMALAVFDNYAKNGIQSESLPGTSVKDLGSQLQYFVDIIGAEVPKREPHGGEQAAECLIFLLREVCNRNHDAFDDNTWERRAPRGEEEDDRNLFQCLIGHPPTGSPAFALDALKTLPEGVLATTDKRERVEEVRGLLHRHQAPVAYRRALQAILDSLTGATSPTAGPQPGQKRPAAGTGRGGQKRTK